MMTELTHAQVLVCGWVCSAGCGSAQKYSNRWHALFRLLCLGVKWTAQGLAGPYLVGVELRGGLGLPAAAARLGGNCIADSVLHVSCAPLFFWSDLADRSAIVLQLDVLCFAN